MHQIRRLKRKLSEKDAMLKLAVEELRLSGSFSCCQLCANQENEQCKQVRGSGKTCSNWKWHGYKGVIHDSKGG